MTGYDGIVACLQQAMADSQVRGVLLDIDSPGGQAAGAFDCADMIYRLRQQKPVWALCNDTACSAAMLLASACSRRLVTQTSRIGSIGVMMSHVSYAGHLQTHTDMPGSDDLKGINVKYRYEFTDTLGLVTSFSYAGDKNRQLTRYSDIRWHEDSVRNRRFSVMAGPSVRVNEWFSAYAMAGVAYSRVSTFSGDYLRVTDNKGKTHDVLTGSDDGRHSNTSLAWGAGVQFNPTESVAIDIAYEGSGSGDWRTDGFIVGVGYKF